MAGERAHVHDRSRCEVFVDALAIRRERDRSHTSSGFCSMHSPRTRRDPKGGRHRFITHPDPPTEVCGRTPPSGRRIQNPRPVPRASCTQDALHSVTEKHQRTESRQRIPSATTDLRGRGVPAPGRLVRVGHGIRESAARRCSTRAGRSAASIGAGVSCPSPSTSMSTAPSIPRASARPCSTGRTGSAVP